jgi:hypothetical protein
MFSGEVPFYEDPNDFRVMLGVVQGKRPTLPSQDLSKIRGLSDIVWKLIETCWAHDPMVRPAAKYVVEQFHALPNQPMDERPVDDFIDFPSQIPYNHTDHPFYGLSTTALNTLGPHHFDQDAPHSEPSASPFSQDGRRQTDHPQRQPTIHDRATDEMPAENNDYFDKLNEPATRHSRLSTSDLDGFVDEDNNSTYHLESLVENINTPAPNDLKPSHSTDTIQADEEESSYWGSQNNKPGGVQVTRGVDTTTHVSWNDTPIAMPDMKLNADFKGGSNKRKGAFTCSTNTDSEVAAKGGDATDIVPPLTKRHKPLTLIERDSGSGPRNAEREPPGLRLYNGSLNSTSPESPPTPTLSISSGGDDHRPGLSGSTIHGDSHYQPPSQPSIDPYHSGAYHLVCLSLLILISFRPNTTYPGVESQLSSPAVI